MAFTEVLWADGNGLVKHTGIDIRKCGVLYLYACWPDAQLGSRLREKMLSVRNWMVNLSKAAYAYTGAAKLLAKKLMPVESD